MCAFSKGYPRGIKSEKNNNKDDPNSNEKNESVNLSAKNNSSSARTVIFSL